MLRVALTGNIASGKSSIVRTWRALGAHVIEADALARLAVAPGTPALRTIAETWGPGVLLPSGELDRAALRDVVFRDPDERRRLEEIVHPEVNRLRRAELAEAEAEGAVIAVSDIPLLFEVGLEDEFDMIVLVDAPAETRLERLVRDRGLPPDEARRMLDAQWPADRKRARADIVIENTGTISDLDARAREVWRMLEAGAEERKKG